MQKLVINGIDCCGNDVTIIHSVNDSDYGYMNVVVHYVYLSSVYSVVLIDENGMLLMRYKWIDSNGNTKFDL